MISYDGYAILGSKLEKEELTMNAKKALALILATITIAALFVGCAAKSYSNGYSDNSGGEAVVAPADGIYNNGSVSPSVTDRKLIRRVSMDLETTEIEQLLTAIDEKVAELGGYVENSKIQIGSDSDADRRATMTVRIPAEQLDSFTKHVAEVSNVTMSSESAEDITLNYVATESRQKALQAEESRLLALIDEAANLTELLQLEKRLTEVRTDLERVTAQLKLYDNLVDYRTVELDIREVQEYTEVEEPGFWTRLGNGFVNSLQNAGKILLEFVILLVCALPYLIFPAVVTVVILLIVKFSKRKKKNISEKQT